ncbi:MAG: flagellar M-ring protein FliF [Candidatus Coatesbacteria bacterium]|nr:flagellar M-ring protein FliF [Candidatus Coatesbacteria bacterium]
MADVVPGTEEEKTLSEAAEGLPRETKKDYLNQMRRMAEGLSRVQKISLGGIAALIMLSIIGLVLWSGGTEYDLLFGDLDPEDAAQIVEQLKEQKVPYKIAAGGTRIEVERGKARDLRLSFIGQGLPSGGKGKGFELFDELKLGATDFVENLNYRRALEGELARTIVRFREVAQARVHLVIPKRSLYWEKQEDPTASVWLRLKGGAGLDRGQVRAVVHLVSGAVQGLSASNITVVDSLGHILTEPEQPQATGLTQAQMQLRKEAEKGFESKIVSLLSPIIGANKVKAKVSITMDFVESKQEQESFDPTEQVLRSEQDLSEESGTPKQVGGVPGTQSNLGEGQAGAADGKEDNYFKRVQRTRNFEIGRTLRTTIEHPGDITRISAAVILDDKAVITEENGERKVEYEPLPAAVVAKCDEIVKKAIGFSKDRGDTVVVENLSFDRHGEEEERLAAEESERGLFWSNVMAATRTPLIIISLMLVFILVIRPLVKGLVVRNQPALVPAAAAANIAGEAGAEGLPVGQEEGAGLSLEGKTVEEIEAEILAGTVPMDRVSKRDILSKRISQIIDSDMENAIRMLRTWMTNGS